ncbi:MAG: hypothetical protein RLY21_1613 [Planctomycetota bacterium]|jgi:hypothetical protein
MLRTLAIAAASLALAASARGTDIYATGFNDYNSAALSGQQAWIGTGGTWAASGLTNAPFLPANVIGPGVNPGVDPVGGRGKMVRLCTERFNNGRTKAWLDLANSGKWAAASVGGNTVLETRVKMFIPSGQPVTSTFGVMISKSAAETSGGFIVSAQTGAISLLNGGYAASNRIATGATATLNAWNEYIYRWNVSTGEGTLVVNGKTVAAHTTTLSGAVYASNLFATTDATPGTGNAFGFFDDLSLAAVAPVSSCAGDLDGDGTRDAADLAAMLGAWGTAAGDVNGDGNTDAADLAALLGGWGACP